MCKKWASQSLRMREAAVLHARTVFLPSLQVLGDVLEVFNVLYVFSGKCHSCVLFTVTFVVWKKSGVCNVGGNRVRNQ